MVFPQQFHPPSGGGSGGIIFQDEAEGYGRDGRRIYAILPLVKWGVVGFDQRVGNHFLEAVHG